MATRKLFTKLFLLSLALTVITTILVIPDNAEAMPHFARHIGRDCTYCHIAFPKLNETGRIYRANGYRFADEEEWQDVRDLETIPVAIEVEIEGVYNRTRKDGIKNEASDLKIEEVEIMAGGAFGKTGKVTVHGVIGVAQGEDDNGDTVYESFIGPAFIQINDLVGPTGHGMLNVRAGQWPVVLPFFGQGGGVIHNKLFANSALGLFEGERRAVELNGTIVGEEETLWPTHRYQIAITRDDVYNEHKFTGFYGSYSLTILEKFSLGGIFRSGKEKMGLLDVRNQRYGGAGQIEVGPAVLTLGYFRGGPDGTPHLDNYVAEIIIIPIEALSLSARIDTIKTKAMKSAHSTTAAIRYNFLSNIYGQIEYRGLKDVDHVTGDNDRERKGRAYLVALF